MKRILIRFLIIAAYISIGIMCVRNMMPDDRILSNNFSVNEDGQALILEQGITDLWIHQVNQEGEVTGLDLCRKAAREVQTMSYYHNNAMQILQMWYQDGIQYLAVYGNDGQHKHFTKIWEQGITEDVNITDFTVLDDEIVILGVEQKTEKIVCYTIRKDQTQKQDYIIDTLPIAAYYGNEGIYIVTSDREVVYLTMDGLNQQPVQDNLLYFKTDANGYFYQKVGSDSLIYQQYDNLITYTYTDIQDVEGIGYYEPNTALVTVSTREGALVFSFFQNETDRCEVTEFLSNYSMYFYKVVPMLLMYTLIFIILIALCSIFYHFLMEKKRLVLQTLGIVLISSVIWVAVLLICVYSMQQKRRLDDCTFYANTCVKIQRENLMDALSKQQLSYDNFRNEEIRQIAEEILSDNTLKDTWHKLFARTEMIYGIDDIRIAYSGETPYGTKAESVYSSEVIGHLKQCNETNEEQEFVALYRGMRYVFHMVPVGNENRQLCLMIRIPLSGMQENNEDFYPFLIGVTAAWIIIMCILLIFLQNRWQTITLLISQMDKISKGDYRLDDRKIPDNEIGEIWKSMERMCRNLQMYRYKNDGVLDYIYQFAPSRFETLFQKKELQNVEIGETVQLSASIATISIVDKDNLLSGKVQRQYIQYVNQLMEILFKQEGAQKAVFLEGGNNLENVKAVFPEGEGTCDDCYEYAVGCMESLLAQPEKRYDTNPFILLHSSEFLCGLAGGCGQAYPFVVSMELEILNSYADDFRKNGVRMVLTQQTIDRMDKQINTRYIGYISEDDRKETFKIYEVLDCCPLSEKSAKLRGKDEFEKALKLFYQCDYYLARSKFSEIIKECPEDGIARWYIFACEALFNQDDYQNAKHALFSHHES